MKGSTFPEAAAGPGRMAPRAHRNAMAEIPRERMAHMLAEGVVWNTLQPCTPWEGPLDRESRTDRAAGAGVTHRGRHRLGRVLRLLRPPEEPGTRGRDEACARLAA